MADTLTRRRRAGRRNRSGCRPTADGGPAPRDWSTLTAYRTPDGVSCGRRSTREPGRIQLRHEAFSGDRPRLAHLTDALAALDGVEGCRVSSWSRTLTRRFSPREPRSPTGCSMRSSEPCETEAGRVPRIARRSPARGERPTAAPSRSRPGLDASISGPGRRLLRDDRWSASSSPGIPTVPFLLATSYYLARSSPRLNDRLRRTAGLRPHPRRVGATPRR